MAARKLDYTGIKALVVGLGDTGASCVRWLVEHDAQVRGTDTRAAPPHALHLREAFPEVALTLGAFAAEDFAWADLVVVSPGVALATPVIQAAQAAGKDIVGDVELFARAIAGSAAKVIAITGSNGKSTVTALAGHLCEAAGLDTIIAGNIGLPVLDALAEREIEDRMPDVWVLELSSFQLETTVSLKPDAVTVLNISEDHMDRYAGLADYASAKARILTAGTQVLNRDDPAVMAMARPGLALRTFGLNQGDYGLLTKQDHLWLAEGEQALIPVDELSIAGLHNAANALAVLALCRAIGLEYEDLLPALRSFKGLPHRVEKVTTVAERTFYDDSKGTNVGATAAALMGFTVPVVLIAGGDGKGQDFSPLREAVRNARAVVQIGRDGPQVEAAIAGACRVLRAETMAEAVQRAYDLSQPGDAVLLSPACASWDMFRNYAHRSEVFIAAVQALKAEVERVS
ncbi:MAG: UDP-N-acetylmuramoyl-L-alanine--D-glutamate ligase [Parasulfuritortus sp.]|nr:UDP-N-acetylmuramoyl-L-alanine--D-glutamate ligase [Parasulfuritortus sp.]